METAKVMEQVVHDHGEMRTRLADWESALEQVTSSSFAESQRGLERLWKLVPFFEKEVARHFRKEEAELFPAVEAREPASTSALARFAREHAEFAKQWQAYKLELLYCDAVGESRRVHELGSGIIRLLRQHMDSEEAELLPLARVH